MRGILFLIDFFSISVKKIRNIVQNRDEKREKSYKS